MRINKEYRDICPPLTESEFSQLEKSIIAEGCRDNLVVWDNTIIDGHNRYDICEKHGIEFDITEHDFADQEEAKIWIIDNQKARRNLTDGWKFELAQVRKKILAKKGKEKQAHGKTAPGKTLLSTIDKSVDTHNTQTEIAKDLGWSTGKVAMADKVWKEAEPEVKDKIKAGETSINQAYSDIKKAAKKEDRKRLIDETRQKIETEELQKPSGLFDVIVIDPPWNYGRSYDPDGSRVANPYPEMSQEELLQLKPPFKNDSILFLWATHAFLWDAKELLDKWGFTYKAVIVWDKDKMGMGAWFRMQCEFCLVGIKGKPVWNNTTYRDIIKEPRREHSRKPNIFYNMVENITIGKKLDYFSRENRAGWDSWGAENGKLAR